jgi:hypothetical protein
MFPVAFIIHGPKNKSKSPAQYVRYFQVTFILYKGKSKHSDKFVLIRSSNPSLGRIETEDERLNQHILEFERVQKIKNRKRKIKRLKSVVKAQETRIKELEAKSSFNINEVMSSLGQVLPLLKGTTQGDQSLAGVPTDQLLAELKKLCDTYGEDRMKDVMMMLFQILPDEKLISEVKELIVNYGKEKAA